MVRAGEVATRSAPVEFHAFSRNSQADEPADVGVCGRKQEAKRASDGGQHEGGADERSAVLRQAVVDERSAADPKHDKGALGDAEQSRVQAVVAQSLDDERGELPSARTTPIDTALTFEIPPLGMLATKPSKKKRNVL